MGCHYKIELTSDNGDPIEVSAENAAEIGLAENDIVLIKGEKGDKGDPGENGADGQPGKQGADGLSAYQIAVDNGFTGTEAEWLASLKGEAGPQGPKGDTGSTGATGPKGDKGDKGETGMTGPQGPQGIQGEKGDSYTLTDEDMKTIADKVEIPDNIMTYSAKNSGVNVRGVSSKTTTYGDGVLVASQGLVMSGTAQNAGLVTRGICGVTTPDAKGSCSKEHLYINYDGDSAYSRKVVLGAGTPGSAISKTTAKDSYGYGNQYTAVRGDQMVNFVTDKVADAKYDDTALKNRVTTLEGKTDADTTYSFTADKATASDGTEQTVTVTKVNGHTVEADVPANAKFTDTVPHIETTGVYEDDTDAVSGGAVYRFIINGGIGHDANSVKQTDMDSALSEIGISTPVDYSNAKMLMANAGRFYKDDQNCVNVLAMAEIINALCQQIDSNATGISAKQDTLTFDSEPTAGSTNPVSSAGIKAYIDKSPLADKKILIIGDSISTDAYGSYKKWVTDLVDDGVFTKSNVTNNSYHATGFVRTYDENSNVVYDNFPNRLKAITDTSYDMVITFGGINDYIGGIEWDAFKTAVDAYFSDLTSRFIDSRLVVISPLRTYNIYKNAAGHYQQEYANYIITVARSYALPVLDLTHGSGYYPFVDTFKAKWTLVPSGYTGGDGVHPNLEYGKKYLAPLIQNFLENPLSGTYTEPANNVDMSAYYTKAEVDAAIAKAIKEATGTKEFAFDGASRTPKKLVWGQTLSTDVYYTNFNANTGGLGYEITDAKITDTEVTFSNNTYYGGPMFVFKCTAGKTYTLSVDVPYGMLSWGELTTTTTSSDTTLPIKAGKPTVLINNWSDSGGHKTFEMKPTTDYFFIAFGKSDNAPITWDNITLTES